MSSSAITITVKGDPAHNGLGDCPFCHRVLLTLANKGIPFDLEYVDLSAPRPQWLLDVSGGKVPVMKIPSEGNLVMPDSDKIVVYLEEKYPDPSMKTNAPEGTGSKLFPAFRQYLQSTPEEQEQKKIALLEELKAINDYLAAPGKGPLFGGKTMDATDAAFAPKLYHCLVALPHYKGFELPQDMTALWRYMACVQMQPAWQAVDYGTEKIIEGWGKHH